MAPSPKNITETLIIPLHSNERFIRFADDDRAGEDNAVVLSGLSDLKSGYLVERPGCPYHFFGYITRRRAMYRSGLNGIELKAGSLLFLRAGTFHHYASKCAFSMVWFHLNAEHPRWRHLAERANFHRAARCMNEVRDLMELNFTESQSPLGRKDSVIEALRRLILAYIDRELAQGDSEDVVLIRCRLEKVWQEVSRNLEKDWDVPKLARIAGMSVSHFHAAVTGAYRISPMKIIRNFRIERAQTLLLNTDCTLESIAERTGYDSPFSLSRAFKAATGISPRFYRRREY